MILLKAIPQAPHDLGCVMTDGPSWVNTSEPHENDEQRPQPGSVLFFPLSLYPSLSLSHKHTQTHTRTHKHTYATHTHTRTHAGSLCKSVHVVVDVALTHESVWTDSMSICMQIYIYTRNQVHKSNVHAYSMYIYTAYTIIYGVLILGPTPEFFPAWLAGIFSWMAGVSSWLAEVSS